MRAARVVQRVLGFRGERLDAVDAWVAASLDNLVRHGFAQIDLDDLLSHEPTEAVRVGIACLRRATEVLPRDIEADGMLTVPLDDSHDWPGTSPRVTALMSGAWTYGPGRPVPGLYLVRHSHWRGVEPVEEYRLPLDEDGLPAGLVAYYRAWRDPGELEFARCVYIRPGG